MFCVYFMYFSDRVKYVMLVLMPIMRHVFQVHWCNIKCWYTPSPSTYISHTILKNLIRNLM